MRRSIRLKVLAAGIVLLVPTFAVAQQQQKAPADPAAQAGARIVCESRAGERNVCPADTSAGVALMKSTGPAACLLGRTWGYDDGGVWVADGCSGEFQLGKTAVVAAAPAAPTPGQPAPAPGRLGGKTAPPPERIETWGEFDPGNGFLVGRSSIGELGISGYALVRYVNQMPGEQTFTDHLGNEQKVDGRNDIWPHRTMVFFKGWIGSPKLIYTVTLWTVLDTNQNAIFGNLGYQFSRKFSLYAGLEGTVFSTAFSVFY